MFRKPRPMVGEFRAVARILHGSSVRVGLIDGRDCRDRSLRRLWRSHQIIFFQGASHVSKTEGDGFSFEPIKIPSTFVLRTRFAIGLWANNTCRFDRADLAREREKRAGEGGSNGRFVVLPVVVLAKKLAVVLDNGVERLGAPQALSGIVVALILTPEGIAGVRAPLGNRLQRSVNLLFGAALTTIALTIPAVILIGLVTGKSVQPGLSPANQVLLAVTLIVSTLTCVTGRTNVLNGFIHLVLFVTYLVLVFEA